MEKKANHKLMSRTDRPFRRIGVQEHTLCIHKSAVTDTKPIDQTGHTLYINTTPIVGKEWNFLKIREGGS